MNETTLMLEALSLLVIGMGIVFGFLLLLVGILRLTSSLTLRLAPAEISPAALTPAALANSEPDDLIAVIGAAVARYRKMH